MSGLMAHGPRYSEDEVALILRRAAELQKQQPLPGDSRSMSLDEIEQAAAEAGLSTALVRRAATEIARPLAPQTKPNVWLGGPTRLVVERIIEGEFPTEEFDQLLEVIRFSNTGPGQVSTVGRSLTWTGVLGAGQAAMLTVTISVRHGQTRVRVHANFANLAGAIFGGIGGGVGGGLGWAAFGGGAMLAGVVGSLGLGFAFLGGVFALCRKVYGGQTKEHALTVHALADELERVIKGQLAMMSGPAALPASEGA
jgi:hypothetical protein